MKREWFRRNWLKSIEYLSVILISSFIILRLFSLARDDDWSAISSIATLILAGVALISILQSKDLRRKELKERALDNIREWAQDISVFTIAPDVKFAIVKDQKERETIETIYWLDFLNTKSRIGKHMLSRANILNSSKIRQSIDEIIKEIEETSTLLSERRSPPLIYAANEFLKVEALNNKALSLIEQLDKNIPR